MTAAPEAPSQAGGFRETERSDLDTRGEKMAALRQAPSGDTRAAFREPVRPVYFLTGLRDNARARRLQWSDQKWLTPLALLIMPLSVQMSLHTTLSVAI